MGSRHAGRRRKDRTPGRALARRDGEGAAPSSRKLLSESAGLPTRRASESAHLQARPTRQRTRWTARAPVGPAGRCSGARAGAFRPLSESGRALRAPPLPDASLGRGRRRESESKDSEGIRVGDLGRNPSRRTRRPSDSRDYSEGTASKGSKGPRPAPAPRSARNKKARRAA